MSQPNLPRLTSLQAVLLRIAASLFLFTASFTLQAADAPASLATPKGPAERIVLEKFIVTGSMIKRIANEGALPMETITRLDMDQQGVASAEQLISQININGNGLRQFGE